MLRSFTTLWKFQFLLVRLRVVKACKRKLVTDISIPSGAIKSVSGNEDRIVKAISIPSGAIKRKRFVDSSINQRHFNSFWCD